MTDVLVVSGEPLWPAFHGGRLRAAGIVAELARHLSLKVLAPQESPPPFDVAFESLPAEAPVGAVMGAARAQPRLGQALLGRRRQAALANVIQRDGPDAVLFAHSYLAAMVCDLAVPVLVDFADVEVRRMRSLAGMGSVRSRMATGWEAVKARRWEPDVARRSLVASAAAGADVTVLSSWGATAVLVPHGAAPSPWTPSPADGPVTYIASFGYAPNRDGARFLLDKVWPRLRRGEPGVRLRLVGRQAKSSVGRSAPEGVEVVSDPESIDAFYDEASVIVAPVGGGGGAQVKVTEALARGRVVVGTAYSALAAPPSTGAAMVVADDPERFALGVAALWRDIPGRHAREKALVESRPVPTWEHACVPLLELLARRLPSR